MIDRSQVEAQAISLCSILAKLYGDDLDRKALWERIGNGLRACSAKAGGDWEMFLAAILDYIKAAPGAIASCAPLKLWMDDMGARPVEHHAAFLRYVELKSNILVVKGRAAWNANKGGIKFADDEPEPAKPQEPDESLDTIDALFEEAEL